MNSPCTNSRTTSTEIDRKCLASACLSCLSFVKLHRPLQYPALRRDAYGRDGSPGWHAVVGHGSWYSSRDGKSYLQSRANMSWQSLLHGLQKYSALAWSMILLDRHLASYLCAPSQTATNLCRFVLFSCHAAGTWCKCRSALVNLCTCQGAQSQCTKRNIFCFLLSCLCQRSSHAIRIIVIVRSRVHKEQRLCLLLK